MQSHIAVHNKQLSVNKETNRQLQNIH